MRDLTRHERWYGRDEPPAVRRTVRAGPLVAELEGPDLRYLRLGEVELVRRLYAAVRDRNWGTIAPQLRDVSLDVGESGFALRFDARNADPATGVDFSWHGEIVGAPDGSLTFSLDGAANAAIEFNRIGWCILHPAENAGRRFRARTPEGVREDTLPLEIGPQHIVGGLPAPLFPAFDRLDVEAADGVWVSFELEGALFEVEDQRNWTDASFKTYSAPLAPSFPHTAQAGERIRQSVRIKIDAATDAAAEAEARDTPLIRLGSPVGRMPAIGVGAASHGVALTARETELLRAASLAHLRVDIEPGAPDWRERLARAALEARALDAALELAIFVPEDAGLLDSAAAALREEQIPLARVLAFSRDEPVSSARTVALVRDHLRAAVGSTPVVGGTNVFFTDINRFRPDLTDVDGIAWPITATVHASDDASVAETPPMHGETVRSARAFCRDRTLHVTPVTFNMRFNPHATGPALEVAPGDLPPEVDRRQPSLLGAGWTMASLRHLAESGAASVTYYETTGWRGLIESQNGPAVPERFASWPGMVFPLYHVLADAGAWQGREVIAIEATDPLAVEALAVRGDDVLHVLIASLAPVSQRCRIEGLPAGTATVRTLDERSFATACSDPAAFRAGAERITVEATLELDLAPYGFVRLDVSA
jgi:D-apionolactonase